MAEQIKDGTGQDNYLKINSDGSLNVSDAGNLIDIDYDYLSLTYVAAGNGAGEVETITYKSGGSGGTTVATITLTYDANDNISTITRT